ncbi:MAG: DUF4097 family beta strand repeat protein [Clostridia bacterium]|nr:DUF4097 family beta strand repeat protein [Clostridia bacterium]
MKKSTKVWLVIAVLCIVIGAVMFTVALSMEGFDFMELTTKKIEINNYKVGDTVDKIYIDTDAADIDFYTYRESEIRVECTETDKIKYDVCVEDSTLKIEVKDDRKWYDYIGFNFTRMLIKVYLPGGVEYSSVVINTTTGDVNVPEQIYTDTLDVKVTTGDIKCYARINESLKLKTTTGDIELKNTDCNGDVEVKVSTGKMIMTDINCRSITCSGTTGDVEMKNVTAAEKLTLNRTTGDILLEGVDANELDITATTGYIKGTLLTEKDFIAKTTTGKIEVPKTAGGKCKLSTTTGDIIIDIVPSA